MEKHTATWAYMSQYIKVMSVHVSSSILISLLFMESIYISPHIIHIQNAMCFKHIIIILLHFNRTIIRNCTAISLCTITDQQSDKRSILFCFYKRKSILLMKRSMIALNKWAYDFFLLEYAFRSISVLASYEVTLA